MAEPLLEVRGPGASRSRPRRASCRRSTACPSTSPPGEVLAVVGESGSGKSVTAMTLMGLTRSPNARFEGTRALQGHRADRRRRGRAAPGARGGDRDDLPGPDDLAEPGPRIGDQIIEQIQEHEGAAGPAGARARHRAARARGHPAGARARRLLPARVLGRHAPARDDRAGAVVRPARPDRRRADHRARRDDPGADPRAHPRAARGDRRRGDPRDPRPRRGGRHRGPHRRDVRGPDRRAGHARRDLLRPPAPLHVGAARLDHAGRPAAPASGCRRSPACRPRWPTGPRAATSGRAARTSSPSAARCRRSRRACRASPTTATAAGSSVEEKRDQREVLPGEIGLPDQGGARPASTDGEANGDAPLVEVDHLKLFFPIKQGIVCRPRGRPRARGQRRDASSSPRARRSASSASRAAARRRCRARSCA